jgi:uncharacterized SAM-binding protein YcdF (DUF218 family)
VSARRDTGRRGRVRGIVSAGVRAAIVLAVLVAVTTPLLFVWPAVDDPPAIRDGGPVDAVVVLGGSPQERFPAAVDLTATLPEPPPTLVLSVQYAAPVVECGRLPSLPRVALTCFSPEPATTSGEALWLARTAGERGWDRVVVTTSDYHVTRSRMLVERCIEALGVDTEVLYHAAPTDTSSLRGAWRIATEWPSLLATPWDHQEPCRG